MASASPLQIFQVLADVWDYPNLGHQARKRANVQESATIQLAKLILMETAMLDISGALNLLKAGHSIERPGSNMKGTSYFLKNENGKEYLFVRQTRLNSSEVIEEPSAFDWDDLTANTWKAVETASNR
jgi:hypothetical protein